MPNSSKTDSSRPCARVRGVDQKQFRGHVLDPEIWTLFFVLPASESTPSFHLRHAAAFHMQCRKAEKIGRGWAGGCNIRKPESTPWEVYQHRGTCLIPMKNHQHYHTST